MKKFAFILIAFASLASSFAQDKSTLDLLVSKGLISREEADKVGKTESAPVFVAPKNGTTEKLKIAGMVQTQYEWVNSEASRPSDASGVSKNGFAMRRLFLGAYADMGKGWYAEVVADFAASGAANAQYVDSAFISKEIEYDDIVGTLKLGYTKVNFNYEEKTSATKLIGIERSAVTRYFSEEQKAGSGNVGFGSRYAGIYWDGKIRQIEGFTYGLALTNSQNQSLRPSTSDDYDNTVNFWANAAYQNTLTLGDENILYKAGFNFGYGSGANSKINSTQYGEIMGVNPYLEMHWRGLNFWADFIMADIENGRLAGAEDATPFGVNVAFEYRFDAGELGAIAPAFHYSYLDTDGRGVRISDAMFGANNIDTSAAASNLYDNAHTIYMGVNWYIMGDSLKLQAGYEWARFSGAPAGELGSKRADVNAVRVQMQVIF